SCVPGRRAAERVLFADRGDTGGASGGEGAARRAFGVLARRFVLRALGDPLQDALQVEVGERRERLVGMSFGRADGPGQRELHERRALGLIDADPMRTVETI